MYFTSNKIRTIALLSLTIGVISLTGCSKNEINERAEYESLKAEATFELGSDTVSQDELSDKLKEFARGVYEPSTKDDMLNGINKIKDYCTESAYNDLTGSIEFNDGSDYKISNITVNKVTNSNTELNGTKEIVEVTRNCELNNKNLEENILIEFYINPNNKIYQFKIWHYNKSI